MTVEGAIEWYESTWRKIKRVDGDINHGKNLWFESDKIRIIWDGEIW